MYDQAALSAMKLSELKEIAKKLNLKKADTLKKQDLINKILDAQGAKPAAEKRIGPAFVGDDKDMVDLATADEVPVAEDPEPAAMPEEDGDDEDDDEGDDESDDEDDDEDGAEEASAAPAATETAPPPPAQERREE
ncbi:MAG TPA: Rho termination factor N-terminal domain-containing protein, partial [Flavobacteriales bacterium]|nr:Rho termination factor N-terminal domain-containing protein [Flavobacteriales bacterium]